LQIFENDTKRNEKILDIEPEYPDFWISMVEGN